MILGVILLVVAVVSTWRAYRRTTRRAGELATYAREEALELERMATRLNEHGFELEHTMSDLAPRLETISAVLNQPLIAAALPWVLRRMLRRPYRRR